MKKRIISLFLCALLIVGVMPITVFATDDAAYLDGRTLYICSVGYEPTAAGFSTSDYDKVVFTSTISEITGTFFYNNSNVKSIVFESDVEIGDSVFAGSTALDEVIFKGESVIGNYAFKDSTTLRRLIFNKKTTVGEQAFYNCGTSYGVEMLPLYIPAESTFGLNSMRNSGFSEIIVMGTLVTIGTNAFYGNEKLTSITTYFDELTLESYAFAYCTALASADFGGTVTIGSMAFYEASALEDVNFDYPVVFGGSQFYGTAIEELDIPEGSSINSEDTNTYGRGAFCGMANLKKITFHSITPMSFYGEVFNFDSYLLKIVVPKGAKEAYQEALASISTNKLYANNVTESDDSHFVYISTNNPDAGTITTSLGECYPSVLSGMEDSKGTAYTIGYIEDGETLQINVKPNMGYTAYAEYVEDDYYVPLTNNQLFIDVTCDIYLRIMYELHDEDIDVHECEWTTNGFYHYGYCYFCECATEYGEHSFNDSGVCSVCGYTLAEQEEYLDSLAGNVIDIEECDDAPLWIGSTNVTRDNCDDVLGDGTVSYDFDTATLSLNSATLNDGAFYNNRTIFSILNVENDLTINVSGECVINGESYSAMQAAGIYNEGNITINGMTDDASLTIDVAEGLEYVYGIAGNTVNINDVTINCNVAGATMRCNGIIAQDVNITDSTVYLANNNQYLTLLLGNEQDTSFMSAIYGFNSVTITDSCVGISKADYSTYGFYNGISCPENDVTISRSDVSISVNGTGINADDVTFDNLNSLCIFADEENFNEDCALGTTGNIEYACLISKHEDKDNWSLLDVFSEDADRTPMYTHNIKMYKAVDVIPVNGYSTALGNTTFTLDKTEAVADCREYLTLTATLNSETLGNIGGFTYDWGAKLGDEKGSLLKGHYDNFDYCLGDLDGENSYDFYCDLYYGTTLIDSAAVPMELSHNDDCEEGRYASCTNLLHRYYCGCGDNVVYKGEHSYDHNGVCRICGYKRVELYSDLYHMDHVRGNIFVDDMSNVTLSEDDFTLSDETCFFEVCGDTVIITRCDTVIGQYYILDDSFAIHGDANSDGRVDGQDAIIAMCIMNGLLTESDIGYLAYKNADLNQDGVIDETDAEIMVQAGLLLVLVDTSLSEEVLLETSEAYNQYLVLIGQKSATEPESEDPEQKEPTLIETIINFFVTIFNYLIRFITGIVK